MKKRSPDLSGNNSEQSARACFSFDVVGDIAILNMANAHHGLSLKWAMEMLATHKGLKTVLRQNGPIGGEYRVRRLGYVAGERKTTTVHKEFGCSFLVDLGACYFSPRLSFERKRIAQVVSHEETIVNMFSGVGCFSILIAKLAKEAKVFSIDINPVAIDFQRKNINVNRVYSQVIPLLGDSREIVQSHFLGKADRVLMPLPEKAFEYLNAAVLTLKPCGGWIHYYDFVHANFDEDPIGKVLLKVSKKLAQLNLAFDISFSRVVRTTGPNWYQVVLDIHVKGSRDKS